MRILLCLISLLWLSAPLAARDGAPVVAAAADLQFAIADLVTAFQAETGQEVRVSLGSTGNFARQIREGAPFELFMAADESFVLDLARDGFTRDEGALYALGRIALIVPRSGVLAADGTLADLGQALADGRVTRFAIANPEHAPYGMRAREALEHTGLWEGIVPRLVQGENVAQAAQFALSGNAQGGIVAYSLALAPQVAAMGDHALIPAEWHAPLLQRMALMPEAGPVAVAFYDYILSEEGRGIMERHGFTLPGDG